MPLSLTQNPLFEALADIQNILIAGAGGGFDVYSGVPLYLALRAQGKNVHLANLSFSFLHPRIADEIFSNCFKVLPDSGQLSVADYFPEKYLAQWLKMKFSEDIPVYAFSQVGVVQLKNAYQYLVNSLDIQAIILADGGTDSLMFGTEPGLGTPSEDSASIAAVYQLVVPKKYLVCLGFGIDHFHGVSHYHFLENVAELAQMQAYLGCFALTNQMSEGQDFINLVNYSNQKMPTSPSIVCNSVASAIQGHFGDYHATRRTGRSELFINPLMNMYWAFELNAVAEKNQFLPAIMNTRSFDDIRFIIEAYRYEISPKKRKNIPL
jgi:hypothetical protein